MDTPEICEIFSCKEKNYNVRNVSVLNIYIITLLTTRFLHKKYGQYKHENLDKFTSQYSYTNYYKYLSLNKKKYHFKSHAAVVVKLQLLVVVVI